jgi:hypothetical protein
MIEAKQIGRDGKLGPITDICEVAAENYMRERWGMDTHPCIVQMRLRGELVPHWYYRSDQWVAQPYFLPQHFLQPYVGPSEGALPSLYGRGTYIIDSEATEIHIQRIKSEEIRRKSSSNQKL